MKYKLLFFCLWILIFNGFYLSAAKNDWPALRGPYLGQKPPGKTPEIFAPGIISTGYSEVCAAFSPDGKELFFGLWEEPPFIVILHMKEENGHWTAPEVAPFSGQYSDLKFNISPEGNKLLFTSKRPLEAPGEPLGSWHIWFVEKTGTGWSKPVNPGPMINSEWSELYPSISKNGNLYYFSDHGPEEGGCDIYLSRFINNHYTKPEKLGISINTEYNEGDSFIAPDESYIIFCCRDRKDGYGANDLYISFRKKNGLWTGAKNMGKKINSTANDTCPSVSPDGKYLFFTSNRKINESYWQTPMNYKQILRNLSAPGNGYSDIYWVSAKIIEELKPKELK